MTLQLQRDDVSPSRRTARRAIPTVDRGELDAVARRTRSRGSLVVAGALVVALFLVLAPERHNGTPSALSGGDGLMVVVDVSSSTLGFSDTIAKSLLVLANDPEQKAGLVLASESAYMALPPDTPGSALRGWQRMIGYVNEQNHKLEVRAKLDRTPLPNPLPGDYPWVGIFTGGTRLSAGLARAVEAIREARPSGGQIVLISDLRDPPEDLPRVAALISRMKELGIPLKIVTVGDASRDPRYFSDFGGAQFVRSAADAFYAPDTVSAPSDAPPALPLVVLGLVLAAILAACESFVPFRWGTRRSDGAR